MQMVSGTCVFVIAVIFLAYLPGKLLLIGLKRTLSPLEDVTLACFLGLIVSGLVYWLMAFAHQGRLYLIWPVIAAGIYVWLFATKRKLVFANYATIEPPSQANGNWLHDRSALAFGGVLALGIIALAFSPLYYTNFTSQPDGTMHVYPVPDVLFHIAIANELTHTVPPQAPLFAGHSLSYHYGMDVVVAVFARATGLNTRDLSVRFVPTLFLALTMAGVFCFSRRWLRSGYFGALVVFLLFFGEDLSFIPGLLLGQDVDWSLRYFSVPPAVLPLFYTNPILPGVGLLFSSLFCLQRYLQERSGAWLFLTAFLFVALIEVKIFTAAQIMLSLGVAAVLYFVAYRNLDLFKVGAWTAALTLPLVWSVLLKNKSEADVVMKFEPGLYISQAMEAIGMKDRFTGPIPFVAVALPLYLVGSLGLRVIGLPAILKSIFRPDAKSALRFILALFVVIGLLIALTFSISPAGWSFRYNPVSGTFLIQSKYVAWLFAVEVLQTFYRWVVARGVYSSVAATTITAAAIALSVPATVQHFLFWRNPDHFFGNGKPFGKQLQTYDADMQGVADFLRNDANPGDVVLCRDELLAPVIALTECRVPFGYFGYSTVPRKDFTHRQSQIKQFWNDWQIGNVQTEVLREAGIRYIVVSKTSEVLPATTPIFISNVFENSEFAVFKVNPERLTETISRHPWSNGRRDCANTSSLWQASLSNRMRGFCTDTTRSFPTTLRRWSAAEARNLSRNPTRDDSTSLGMTLHYGRMIGRSASDVERWIPMAGIVIKPRARILHGHDWVFSSEVLKVFGKPADGDVISLKDGKDHLIGSAIYNSKSQIVARRFSRRRQDLDQDFFRRRIEQASEYRDRRNMDAKLRRVVWSESDGLPGVIIDRYGDDFVVQTLTLAMDMRKDLIVDAIEQCSASLRLANDGGASGTHALRCIIERNDAPVRRAEGMELRSGVLRGNSSQTVVEVAGIKLEVDCLRGHKTGLYLDQKHNYGIVARYARDRRVLDCFTNQGAFALACSRAGAMQVTAIEENPENIAAAKRNAERNQIKVDWVQRDVFQFLRAAEKAGSRYDLIVLDPPSFTRTKTGVRDALRGYRELHTRAFKLLSKDGLLATFSCSHHVDDSVFLQTITDALVDARRSARRLRRFEQAADHPVLPTIPETEYFRGFLLEMMPGR